MMKGYGWMFGRIQLFQIEYSIMTEVIVEEQLELTSIVEVVQTKLVKNFTLLLKRLNKNDQALLQQAENTLINHQSTSEAIARLEQLLAQQDKNHALAIEQLTKKIELLQERQTRAVEESKELPVGIKRLNDELFNTQLQFEEKLKNKQRELEEVVNHIHTLALEQNRLNDEVNKKENKVEAERLVKDTEILKDKNSFFQNQLKLANHKIEKMQILNEKAERVQAKKELEIMKEIEERVKKELRIITTGPISNTYPNNAYAPIQNKTMSLQPGSTSTPNLFSDNPQTSNPTPVRNQGQMINSSTKRVSGLISEDQLLQNSSFGTVNAAKDEMEHIIERWSEKMRYFQIQLKEINENLKILNKTSSHKKTESNKENNAEAFKDRLNEIKPEIVKLWAKLDTMEDRLSFSERKTDEKLKGINELATLVKENNVSKLDEKLKSLQTEIFTSLKEVKSKLEGKVSQTQYDKYRQQIDEKIGQINDLIYLKSDKLEVKKALLFLESKIKEIILVISEDEQNEKDALLTKKQLKCISCDKEVDKFSGVISSPKGNWDSLPFKDHPPEILGRFGMTNFGSLAKKIKKLESKDLPVLNKRNVNQSFQNSS